MSPQYRAMSATEGWCRAAAALGERGWPRHLGESIPWRTNPTARPGLRCDYRLGALRSSPRAGVPRLLYLGGWATKAPQSTPSPRPMCPGANAASFAPPARSPLLSASSGVKVKSVHRSFLYPALLSYGLVIHPSRLPSILPS